MCFINPVVTPKTEESSLVVGPGKTEESLLVVDPSSKTEETALLVGPSVLVRGPLTVQDVLTGKPNGSISLADPSLSSACDTPTHRKKRKVSFAPGPPTSFSHHDQPQEVSRPESPLRRKTRSSSALKTLAESSAEASRGKEEQEERGVERLDLPSVSSEKLSDEESISSCASSVASTGESSSTPGADVAPAPKRRGRPRKKVSLARATKKAVGEEGAARVESASEDAGAKVVEPMAVERAFKTGIVAKQSRARGKCVGGWRIAGVTMSFSLPSHSSTMPSQIQI